MGIQSREWSMHVHGIVRGFDDPTVKTAIILSDDLSPAVCHSFASFRFTAKDLSPEHKRPRTRSSVIFPGNGFPVNHPSS